MNKLMEQYLRVDALPTLFCPGCGNGIVQNAVISAIDKLDIREEVAFVSGIGCSSWIPCYFNMDVMHTTHGRALAFAQGLKLARPDKKIIVFTGDGDCLAIGGNHFMHACKRNIDLTVILVNNHIYGMTGGQKSPATPRGVATKTSPWGSYEEPMQGAETGISLGASYVARWTTAHPVQLQNSIEAGINHKGLSLIEVISQCPTQSGKEIYGDKNPAFIMEHLKNNSFVYNEALISPDSLKRTDVRKFSTTENFLRMRYNEAMEEPVGKIKCGILKHDNDRAEYIERMRERMKQFVIGKHQKEQTEKEIAR